MCSDDLSPRAGHLQAPARLLAAMERHTNGRESETESAVRTTDVANRRIVAVQPQHTTAATATAQHLREQLTSLTAALETLPLGREGLTAVESGSSAQAVSRKLELAGPAPARVHRDHQTPIHDMKAVRSPGPRF